MNMECTLYKCKRTIRQLLISSEKHIWKTIYCVYSSSLLDANEIDEALDCRMLFGDGDGDKL